MVWSLSTISLSLSLFSDFAAAGWTIGFPRAVACSVEHVRLHEKVHSHVSLELSVHGMLRPAVLLPAYSVRTDVNLIHHRSDRGASRNAQKRETTHMQQRHAAS